MPFTQLVWELPLLKPLAQLLAGPLERVNGRFRLYGDGRLSCPFPLFLLEFVEAMVRMASDLVGRRLRHGFRAHGWNMLRG